MENKVSFNDLVVLVDRSISDWILKQKLSLI